MLEGPTGVWLVRKTVFRPEGSAAPSVVVVAIEAVDIVTDDRCTEPDVLAVQVVGNQPYLQLALKL